MEDKLFSIEDAALYLGGISIWTIRAWLRQGRMNRSKVGGRTMIRRSELDKIIRHGEDSRPDEVVGMLNDQAFVETRGRRATIPKVALRAFPGECNPKAEGGSQLTLPIPEEEAGQR